MNELTKLYDSIHMPQDLEARIRNSAPVHRRRVRPALAAVAALLVVGLLGCSPGIQAAVDEMLVTVFPGLDVTIYRESAQEGGDIVRIEVEKPTFAHVENGRLYFTGNGENIDITDQITEEAPFFYTYEQDIYEITLVVGYSGSLENFGTYEFIKENGEWFTGSGRNFYSNTEEGVPYPWVKVVWDTLQVPWPMPG